MNFNPNNIIGKTVNACISRPGPGQMSRVYMMMFTDGSCCEFVSGRNTNTQLPAAQGLTENGLALISGGKSGGQSRQLSLSGF